MGEREGGGKERGRGVVPWWFNLSGGRERWKGGESGKK